MKTFERLLAAALFGLLALAWPALDATAATTSGLISGPEIWSGTIFLKGDVTVTATGNLTILPGTIVQADAGADDQIHGLDPSRIELIVEDGGTLSAVGTADNPILFTSSPVPPKTQAPSDWQGVRVNSNNATFKYCTIEFAENGMSVGDQPSAGFFPAIENCIFQDNRSTGILIAPAGVTIRHSIFRRNGTGIVGNGMKSDLTVSLMLVACDVSENTLNGLVTIGVVDCTSTTISKNGLPFTSQQEVIDANDGKHGVGVVAYSGGNFDGCVISNNNGFGMVLCWGYPFGFPTATVSLKNCLVNGNALSGLDVQWNSTLSVSDSTVTQNLRGILSQVWTSLSNVTLAGNSEGIQLLGGNLDSCVVRENGSGIVGREGGSGIIVTNSLLFSNTYEVNNRSSSPILADGNYWGEPTTTELQTGVRNLTKIYDSRDEADLGQVVIRSWLQDATPLSISPSIARQPADQTTYQGNTATLAVLVNGSAPLSFQWFKGADPLSGATSATLIVKDLLPTDSGSYTLRISNSAGAIASDPIVLTVKPTSDTPFLSLKTFAAIAVEGTVGKTYSIQFATDPDREGDWTAWTTLTNLVLPSTPFVFVDPTSGGNSKRFYRATLLP